MSWSATREKDGGKVEGGLERCRMSGCLPRGGVPNLEIWFDLEAWAEHCERGRGKVELLSEWCAFEGESDPANS